MIKRNAEDTLLRLSEQFPVIAITGPRQSGKTTLAKNTFKNKEYVTFDDERMKSLALKNPHDFLLAYEDGAIIDEAQKVPGIFNAIKINVDNSAHTPGKFILTGSSQFRLKENITDSLAGRIGMINLLPLSITEIKNSKLLPRNIYDMSIKGMYPTLYDDERKSNPDDWYTNYINTYLDIDVKDNINHNNINTFKKFLKACAHYSGKEINLSDVSNKLGVSSPTLNNWLSILTSSFIVHLIYPDHNNLFKSLVKKPKLYFLDSGLLCYLLNIKTIKDLIQSEYRGHIIESIAISEIMKYFYNEGKQTAINFLRTKGGFEIDVLVRSNENFAIEVKSTIDAKAQDAKNINKLNGLTNNDYNGMIFYTSDTTLTSDAINYVSWKDWGNIFDSYAKSDDDINLKFATNEDIENLFK